MWLEQRDGETSAAPVFGKPNLICTLIHTDRVEKIEMDVSDHREGERDNVWLH